MRKDRSCADNWMRTKFWTLWNLYSPRHVFWVRICCFVSGRFLNYFYWVFEKRVVKWRSSEMKWIANRAPPAPFTYLDCYTQNTTIRSIVFVPANSQEWCRKSLVVSVGENREKAKWICVSSELRTRKPYLSFVENLPQSNKSKMSNGNVLEPTTLIQNKSSSVATPWTNMATVSDSQHTNMPNNSARKRNMSTARRASMLSLGMRHVRDISKSVKSVADNELKFEAIRFAHTTTAHGVSMSLNAHSWFVSLLYWALIYDWILIYNQVWMNLRYGRYIWLFLSICSLSIFVYQSYFVLQKYHRKDKISFKNRNK